MPDDWQQYRGIIIDLYHAQNKTCEEVRRHMQRVYGFSKSVRSYRSHLKRWGIRKYQKHKGASTPGLPSPCIESRSPITPGGLSPLHSTMDTDEPSPSTLINDGLNNPPGPIPLDAGIFSNYLDNYLVPYPPSYQHGLPSPHEQNTTEFSFAVPSPGAPSSPVHVAPWVAWQRGVSHPAVPEMANNFEPPQLSIQIPPNSYNGIPQFSLTPAPANDPALESEDCDFADPVTGPASGPGYYYNNSQPPRSRDRRR